MASIALAFVLVYLILTLGVLSKEPYGAPPNTIPVRGPDDIVYYVQEDLDDREQAAAIIAEPESAASATDEVYQAQVWSGHRGRRGDCMGEALSERVRQAREFLLRFNPDAIYETNPDNPNEDSSFVISKGKLMALCIRKRNDPTRFEDMNMLTFVLIHEASHYISSLQLQHEPSFWRTMKFVLEEAVEAGIYKPIDYRKTPPRLLRKASKRWSPLYDDGVPAMRKS